MLYSCVHALVTRTFMCFSVFFVQTGEIIPCLKTHSLKTLNMFSIESSGGKSQHIVSLAGMNFAASRAFGSSQEFPKNTAEFKIQECSEDTLDKHGI